MTPSETLLRLCLGGFGQNAKDLDQYVSVEFTSADAQAPRPGSLKLQVCSGSRRAKAKTRRVKTNVRPRRRQACTTSKGIRERSRDRANVNAEFVAEFSESEGILPSVTRPLIDLKA